MSEEGADVKEDVVRLGKGAAQSIRKAEGKFLTDKQKTAAAEAVWRGIQILITIALPLLGYVFATQQEQAERLTIVEATRFTGSDGITLKTQIEASLNLIEKRVEDLHRDVLSLPKEVPPAWFLDRVHRLEIMYDDFSEKLDGIRQDLATLKAQKNQ